MTAVAGPVGDPAQRSPVVFFLLVFGLSVPFWLAGWRWDFEFVPGLPVSALGFVCPLLAALILACRGGGLGGAGTLLRPAVDVPLRRQVGWLLPAMLLFPVLLISSSAVAPSGSVSTGAVVAALPMAIAFLVAAAAEELGWSAYATHPMRVRLGALGAGLVIGGVWAAWHVVPYLQAGRAWSWIAWQVAFTIAARVILVWLYSAAGRSMVAATLAHASINVAVFLVAPVSTYDPRVAALASGGVALAVSIAWSLRKTDMNQASSRRRRRLLP